MLLSYLTNLISYYLPPPTNNHTNHSNTHHNTNTNTNPNPNRNILEHQQLLSTPTTTINLNAISLAAIASQTDQLTTSTHSFFNPTTEKQPPTPLLPPPPQPSKQILSNKTFLFNQNRPTRISSSPAYPSHSLLSFQTNSLSPRATQDLISRLETTSPLLPQNLANFITAASLAARVSLRSSAFFIELILESLRYSTTTSLGITRRALISAVGSARAIHYSTNSSNQQINTNNNSYLNVLDHYTNVGIYLVHHVFTMAELLSIAGIDLTHSVISTGFETAEVSVIMLDTIFGSNESSRALSAIIMLVRRELLHDPRFTPSHSSAMTGLISLTKAITAFACLQLATSRRTTGSMKMRVVWDATIVTQSISESSSLAGGIDYQLGIKQGRAHGCRPSEALSPETNPISTTSTRHSPRQSIHQLSESAKSSLVTDLRSTMNGHATRIQCNHINSFNSSIVSSSTSQAPAHRLDEREEIEYELTQILTDGQDNDYQNPPNTALDNLSSAPSNSDKQVPEDVRKALYHVKRSSYSRTQSYSSGLANLATTTVPDHSSTSTYQLTTLTTQTTRTRTTTTSTTHSSNPPDNNHIKTNTTSDHPSNSSSKHPYEAYQIHWSTNLQPALAPSNRPSKLRIITQHSKVHPQSNQLGHQSPSDYFTLQPRPSKAKSMPSSPQRSLFFSQPKLVRRSLTRSKTHSDVNNLLLLDDPYSFVYPIPTIVPSQQTPPSSPSVISEESSFESDGPVIPADPNHRPVSFPSSISEISQEDQGYLGQPEGSTRVAIPTSPQKSSTSIQTIRTNQVSQSLSSTAQPPSSDFPAQSLVKNLSQFMRYSSAAYGQQFLRIMGIGVDSFNYPNTKKHSANDHAFASHVGLAVDQILLSSFTEPNPVLGNEALSPLVHYVSLDHDSKAVVLTCRGTLGLSDILVDLTCEYEPITVDGGDPAASYLAHSGMLHSALRLRKESSTVHEVIKQALVDYPSYGLIITGHSLGGGVAALLAVLCSTRTETFLAQTAGQSASIAHPPISTRFVTSFRSGFPPGRPIHSYTYGTPAVASLDLSEYTKGLVTTVCNGIDIVPTLSLGVLHDLKSIAVSLHEEESVAIEIVKKVVGLYHPKASTSSSSSSQQQQAQQLFESQPSEDEQSKQHVPMKDHEIRNGIGDNRASGSDYRDPALEGSVFGKAELTPELGDWLWSLRRTMLAVSDAEKLFPPGEVWHVESYEVFVVREDENNTAFQSTSGQRPSLTTNTRSSTCSRSSSNSYSSKPASSNHFFNPTASSSTTRREGRRIILRACDDVQARFSEPIFGKTMFHDHIPSQYELVLELLETATLSYTNIHHSQSSSPDPSSSMQSGTPSLT